MVILWWSWWFWSIEETVILKYLSFLLGHLIWHIVCVCPPHNMFKHYGSWTYVTHVTHIMTSYTHTWKFRIIFFLRCFDDWMPEAMSKQSVKLQKRKQTGKDDNKCCVIKFKQIYFVYFELFTEFQMWIQKLARAIILTSIEEKFAQKILSIWIKKN